MPVRVLNRDREQILTCTWHGKPGRCFRRDLLTDLSYKLSFALQALHVLLGIAAYYFLARLLGESTPGGYAPFPFLLVAWRSTAT